MSSISLYITIFFTILAALIGISAVIGFVLQLLFVRQKVHDRLKKFKTSVLFEVRVPRDNEVEIAAADQMFAGLYSIYKDSLESRLLKASDYISFEIVGLPDDIRFFVHTPGAIQDLVEKTIHASYPMAEVKISEEYNIFTPDSHVEFAQLRLAKGSYFPTRTYEDLKVDTISAITSTLSRMQQGEGAAIQIIISPANGRWSSQGRTFLNNIEKRNSDPNKTKLPVDSNVTQGVEKKIVKVGFNTIIRIVASAQTKAEAKNHLDNILGSFQQFNNPVLNRFKKEKIRFWAKKEFVVGFVYRFMPIITVWRKKPSVLNTAELASIFHFPNKNIQTPHIAWLKATRAPASADVPEHGDVYIGVATYRGKERTVAMNEDDRRRHMYVVGKTGSGKSKLLEWMILQDIRNGKGLAFLDPHGQSARFILDRIPPERVEDVIYFNPGDYDRPMGMNILEFFDEQDKHRIVNSFYHMLEKLFDPNRQGITGPRLERAIRNSMLTAMAREGNTLIEVLRLLLLDQAFIKEMLKYLTDDVVRKYWTEELAQTSDYHKSETLGYFASKLDRFVTNKMMRNILGQSHSSFNFRDIMDNKKILIVDLDKGVIGEENSQFLGLILVPKLLSAAMSRTNIEESKRSDFYLYVDEFQNFATEDFAQILSEARKYRLNLVVANQYIAQMTDDVRNAVFGNVGTLVSFKVGVNDAQYLAHEFNPIFSEKDLINIENRNAYIKLLVNGEYPAPFSIRTIDISGEKPNVEIGETVTQLSRLRYGRDKEVVEADIKARNTIPAVFDNSPQMGYNFAQH